jgi:hypothetical protein
MTIETFPILINQAKNWLRDSGVIQASGATTAWIAPEQPSLQFISSEITGYMVSYLCMVGETELAARCVQWLIGNAIDQEGAVRSRWYCDDQALNSDFSYRSPLRWVFDTSIVLKGLVDFYHLAPHPQVLVSIEQMVAFLERIRHADGLLPGRWHTGVSTAADDSRCWSAQTGPFHLKSEWCVAFAALQLHRCDWISSLEERVSRYIEKFQNADGGFVSYPHTGGIHTHPHLYACEGLWALGILFDHPDWLKASRAGIEWVCKYTHEGKFPRTYFADRVNYHNRGDAVFQFLRCLVLCREAPYLSLAETIAENLVHFINEQGAVIFGFDADGRLNRHPDIWATAIAVQALSWYLDPALIDPITII